MLDWPNQGILPFWDRPTALFKCGKTEHFTAIFGQHAKTSTKKGKRVSASGIKPPFMSSANFPFWKAMTGGHEVGGNKSEANLNEWVGGHFIRMDYFCLILHLFLLSTDFL